LAKVLAPKRSDDMLCKMERYCNLYNNFGVSWAGICKLTRPIYERCENVAVVSISDHYITANDFYINPTQVK